MSKAWLIWSRFYRRRMPCVEKSPPSGWLRRKIARRTWRINWRAGALAEFVRWERCKARRSHGGTMADPRWGIWLPGPTGKCERAMKMELRKTFQFEAAHLLPHL